jgi:L-ascorbate metabolism protein UlaG (beta-lactamase superfamily)
MPSSFDYFGVKATWLCQSGFLLSFKEKNVYIDPYRVPEDTPTADLIVITHEHGDHCNPTTIGRLVGNETRIVAAHTCQQKLSMFSQLTSFVHPGDYPSAKYFYLKTIAAYNPAKPFHPRGNGMGVVIPINNRNFYHAGDTDFVPEMSWLKSIDVAFLPIGGKFTMDVEQAAKAANTIKPKVVIPMHFEKDGDIKADPEELRGKLDAGIKLEVLEPAVAEEQED